LLTQVFRLYYLHRTSNTDPSSKVIFFWVALRRVVTVISTLILGIAIKNNPVCNAGPEIVRVLSLAHLTYVTN